MREASITMAGTSAERSCQYNRAMPLPTAIYSAAQVRELDDYAIHTLGVPGYTLMRRAGESSLRALRARWPTAYRLAIVCGGGNNGGDGYVLARFARAAGLTVQVFAATPVDALKGDALRAAEDFLGSGGVVEPFSAPPLARVELVVDALLGLGLQGSPRESALEIIDAMNECGRPVFSLDVPSGLCADQGTVLGRSAVRADCTLTFLGLKAGLFLGDAPEHVGTLYCDDLEIEAPASPMFAPVLQRLPETAITSALPRRRRASHKGTYGRVLIVGGATGMPGAARLAGEAAMRVGAGLVTVATAPDNVAAIAAGCPEVILAPFSAATELEDAIERADVIAIGPGLGRSEWARDALQAVLESNRPLIVDADALNLVAERSGGAAGPDWILTPHPGEAARLLGVSIADVQADRLGALHALVGRYGGTVVLKGAGTLVGRQGEITSLCDRGNPGMASAGMGDVLTGVIAGILAQCRDVHLAARAGVLVHSQSGDSAARSGERGLVARDVLGELRTWVNV